MCVTGGVVAGVVGEGVAVAVSQGQVGVGAGVVQVGVGAGRWLPPALAGLIIRSATTIAATEPPTANSTTLRTDDNPPKGTKMEMSTPR